MIMADAWGRLWEGSTSALGLGRPLECPMGNDKGREKKEGGKVGHG